MKTIQKKEDIIFVFESEDELRGFEQMLKEMRKTHISHQYYFMKHDKIQYSIHNGKPSIPEYNNGKRISGLLTEKTGDE